MNLLVWQAVKKKLEEHVKELHDIIDALGAGVLSKFDGTERQLCDLHEKVNLVLWIM